MQSQPQNWPIGGKCTCVPHNEPTADDIRALEMRPISRITTNLHWSFTFGEILALVDETVAPAMHMAAWRYPSRY